MPVSKRAKKVTLTKTSKKEAAPTRSAYIDTLRSAIEAHSSVFIVESATASAQADDQDAPLARPTQFKEVRKALRDLKSSRLFLGKRTLMQIALGKTEEDELRPNLRLLSDAVRAGSALVVSDDTRENVDAALRSCKAPEFATAGFVPTTALTLEAGPVKDAQLGQVSMQPTLKKIGLSVEVEDSRLVLINDFVVTQPGVPLGPEQAKLLKHLGLKLDTFLPRVRCGWVDGEFE
ncbi:hypothetical protein M885DRAFT_505764 [Pelagophyceae sp. CCMP2097]|nr:hypothetical protein M885DRAFT_505764 [Pelagophyceae sp. CCMP2097]|mmetsp:Transcript_19832/g.67105  ORF Transcript_19832/g.67105 Transcript_19832/m.67105 type:complete len:234 (+) Transcript_19832:60-761(+)|eukprot:CAMPEP_0184085938 /NCGR_PEP_ID=MMETSP0974-20121125/4960_1 /TAXON_ID=483370 /ORGANISM="non described non described, Strain CCMP2097" /LENGTH=233 /DNA_ID=CAMNT_0026388621 /DNA_START=14 /DNA_END=715 /DNA_ORIENTATION=+